MTLRVGIAIVEATSQSGNISQPNGNALGI